MTSYLHSSLAFLMLLIVSLPASFAQNDADLFILSKEYYSGSARFNAMGGAFGSLGADISSVQINPAAMGRFSSSQATISLGTALNNTASNFIDTKSKANNASFSLPSIGIVLTRDLSDRNKGDMYSQFGFGMNRLAHFNRKTIIEGQQFPSMLDNFIGQADGVYPDQLSSLFPFSTSLAWESYVIDFDSTNLYYTSHLNSGDMKMKRTITTTGGINEFFISYSRNRLNKLYYGGSIGIRTYNRFEGYTHSEDLVLEDPTFNGFDYEYQLKTSGFGANLKLGIIYLVTDGFRLGFSLHSPTISSLTDKWTATMTGRFNDNLSISVPTDLVPKGQFKYRMLTPFRANASASYVIGLNALLSADIEYVGYNQGRLLPTKDITYQAYGFGIENEDIKKRLTNAVNFRLGAEFNIQQKLFLRAGFAFYGNAYKKSENVDPKPDLSYSGGLGYKYGRFSIDLSYVYRNMKRVYYPFPGSSTANTKLTDNLITVTGSIRF
ncbi:MAG: hypothetical protein M9916_09765 [Crocinitomicaceae bacterium]|nr:hypothetical protein [Crocinitomicaceae bacterium]